MGFLWGTPVETRQDDTIKGGLLKKMDVAVTLRAFTQTREQTVLRNSSAVTTQRSQRGRALFDNTLKSTTRGDGARCWLNFRQGSWGGRLVTQWVELGGVMLILRCCSLSCGHSPCAGISCNFLPRNIPSGSCSRETSWNTPTHPHTKEKDKTTLGIRLECWVDLLLCQFPH